MCEDVRKEVLIVDKNEFVEKKVVELKCKKRNNEVWSVKYE